LGPERSGRRRRRWKQSSWKRCWRCSSSRSGKLLLVEHCAPRASSPPTLLLEQGAPRRRSGRGKCAWRRGAGGGGVEDAVAGEHSREER
jgi:hypothetical protein